MYVLMRCARPARSSTHGPFLRRVFPLLRILDTSLATLGFSATFSTLMTGICHQAQLSPGFLFLALISCLKLNIQKSLHRNIEKADTDQKQSAEHVTSNKR